MLHHTVLVKTQKHPHKTHTSINTNTYMTPIMYCAPATPLTPFASFFAAAVANSLAFNMFSFPAATPRPSMYLMHQYYE